MSAYRVQNGLTVAEMQWINGGCTIWGSIQYIKAEGACECLDIFLESADTQDLS